MLTVIPVLYCLRNKNWSNVKANIPGFKQPDEEEPYQDPWANNDEEPYQDPWSDSTPSSPCLSDTGAYEDPYLVESENCGSDDGINFTVMKGKTIYGRRLNSVLPCIGNKALQGKM